MYAEAASEFHKFLKQFSESLNPWELGILGYFVYRCYCCLVLSLARVKNNEFSVSSLSVQSLGGKFPVYVFPSGWSFSWRLYTLFPNLF